MNDDASAVASRRVAEAEAREAATLARLRRLASAMAAARAEGNALHRAGRHAEACAKYADALARTRTRRPGEGARGAGDSASGTSSASGASSSDHFDFGALAGAFAATCFCNRAAAAHADGRYLDALADCGRALATNPARLKSVSRRAQIHLELRMPAEALRDLEALRDAEARRDRDPTAFADAAAGGIIASGGTTRGSAERSAADFSSASRLREARRAATLAGERKTPPDLVAALGLNKTLLANTSNTGVSSASSLGDGDVRKAYRAAALRLHPDKATAQAGVPAWADADFLRRDAERLFKLVGEARDALGDPARARGTPATRRGASARRGRRRRRPGGRGGGSGGGRVEGRRTIARAEAEAVAVAEAVAEAVASASAPVSGSTATTGTGTGSRTPRALAGVAAAAGAGGGGVSVRVLISIGAGRLRVGSTTSTIAGGGLRAGGARTSRGGASGGPARARRGSRGPGVGFIATSGSGGGGGGGARTGGDR